MAPPRSRSLAIAACCAFAGNALGQTLKPLHVDPALLGAKPPATPAPRESAVSRPQTAPTPKEPPIVAPVIEPRVERVPAVPEAAPGVQPPRPQAPATRPLPSVPPRRPAEPEKGDAGEPAQPVPEAAEDADRSGTPAPLLRPSSNLTTQPASRDDSLPTFLSAERIHGVANESTVAEGDVELRRLGTVVNADRLTYRPIEDELLAEGNVRLAQEQSVIAGPKLQLRLEDQVGYIDQPAYVLRRSPPDAATGVVPTDVYGLPLFTEQRKMTEAHGQATRIEFQGENQFQLKDATYSTCKPGDDSWFARVSDLHLDYDREVGEGHHGTVYFKGVPILYSPWLTFPLNNQRKSGFLPPTIGSTSLSGFEFTLPYYWNIAPNMDATVAPRIYTKRGLQLNTEFRYLGERHSGRANVEWLPDDRVRHLDRWGYSFQHNQDFGYGLSGALNLNGVSDDLYYRDLSSRVSSSAQTLLARQGVLSYGAGWWWASAQVLKYQTLQPDPDNPVEQPYETTPQINLGVQRTVFDVADTALLGQFTEFSHPDPTRPQARRSVLYPQVSLPLVKPAFYLTPKVGVHLTRYQFERPTGELPASYSRDVPIASIDAGMTFERSVDWFGRGRLQTLEPRFFYLNVPKRDQSVLTNNGPVVNGQRRGVSFDTAVADFNFAQIFSENQFTGHDRIADANQLTAAVTSRLLDPGTGSEQFKVMLGQRFYFSDQTVTLHPRDLPRTSKKTDLLAAANGQIAPRTYLDAAWQYNPRDARTERFNIGGRYQPEAGKVLNLAYRFGRNQSDPFEVNIKQIDLSGQWPLGGGFHGVGRYNYSISEKRVIETIGGFEYTAGCWSTRFVLQRFATTATESTTAMFVQLELTDFSRIGSNPTDLLKRSIPGYGQVDQPAADPVFGTN